MNSSLGFGTRMIQTREGVSPGHLLGDVADEAHLVQRQLILSRCALDNEDMKMRRMLSKMILMMLLMRY